MKLVSMLAGLMMPIMLAQAPAKPVAPPPPSTLRSVLLRQLQTTHTKADWFVPVNTAIAGMTAEQAKWVPTNAAGKLDPNENHSVGMLAYHLWFWNSRSLARLKGDKVGDGPAKNEDTFNDFDAATWTKVVQGLDTVMTELEAWVEHASDADLAKNAEVLAHIGTHNAYHTGQILYVRKLQGSWNPDSGVKS